MKIQEALNKVVDGVDLTEAEMISAMEQIMEGSVCDS